MPQTTEVFEPIALRLSPSVSSGINYFSDGEVVSAAALVQAILNHPTRDSDTRCPGHVDIACARVLPVYECCMARFKDPSERLCLWESFELVVERDRAAADKRPAQTWLEESRTLFDGSMAEEPQ